MIDKIQPLLAKVEKPGRYVGGEMNVAKKNWEDVAARIALAFPDVYEIGASYHGFRILYERINARAEFLADRVCCPWPDFAQELQGAALPLYALDQLRPLRDFDAVGFTLQHELNYLNVLLMLELAGVPLESGARGDGDPLILAGGEGALAPEPMAPFIDAFVVGDGEEVALEILEAIKDCKANGVGERAARLLALARIPGVYVPALHEIEGGEGEAPVIDKRCYDITRDDGPVRPVVPLIQAVHDRFVVEIRRGCTRGCRFCAAGAINRPVRERTPAQVLNIVKQGVTNTGHRDVSLLALSAGDHSCILETVRLLNDELAAERVSISLPSLRVKAFDVRLAAEISRVRKTGFTFAPEAGSERLRRVINKPLDREELSGIVEEVCRQGWRTLKFYFMIGLPSETEADLDGIVEIVRDAHNIGRAIHGKKIQLNISLSPFVPKPHTPLQWEAQPPREELERRYGYVAEGLREMRGVSLKRHSTKAAFIEAVLARGDRRLAPVLKRAYELGCRYDGWSEWFRFERWLQAFADCGVDPAAYANRERPREERLPWDHINAGLGKDFLWKEREAAFAEEETPDCVAGECAGCQVCQPAKGIGHRLADSAGDGAEPEPPEARAATPRAAAGKPQPAIQRLRFTFSKTGRLRYLSHLDLIRALQQLAARLQVPHAWSCGFHPQPVMQFCPPLGLGVESEGECADVMLVRRVDPLELLRELDAAAPAGMAFSGVEEIPLRAPSLESAIRAAGYRVELAEGAEALKAAFVSLRDSENFVAAIKRKSKVQEIDLKERVAAIEIGERQVEFEVRSCENSLIGVARLLEALAPETDASKLRIVRTRLTFEAPRPSAGASPSKAPGSRPSRARRR